MDSGLKTRCKIVKKALVVHTDLLGPGRWVTISSSNPWTAITCSFWSLLFLSPLNGWLKDERLCSWSLELWSLPNLLSSACVRLQDKWPFSCSMFTVVKWESGALLLPKWKVGWQQTDFFLTLLWKLPCLVFLQLQSSIFVFSALLQIL